MAGGGRTGTLQIRAVTFDLWLTLIWDSEELEEYRRLRRLINFHRFAKKYEANRTLETKRFGFNDVRLALEELSERVRILYEQGFDVHPNDRGRMLFEILKIKLRKSEESEIHERVGRILSNSGYHKKFPHVNPEAKLDAQKSQRGISGHQDWPCFQCRQVGRHVQEDASSLWDLGIL